jgi:hypothetical protein
MTSQYTTPAASLLRRPSGKSDIRMYDAHIKKWCFGNIHVAKAPLSRTGFVCKTNELSMGSSE